MVLRNRAPAPLCHHGLLDLRVNARTTATNEADQVGKFDISARGKLQRVQAYVSKRTAESRHEHASSRGLLLTINNAPADRAGQGRAGAKRSNVAPPYVRRSQTEPILKRGEGRHSEVGGSGRPRAECAVQPTDTSDTRSHPSIEQRAHATTGHALQRFKGHALQHFKGHSV